MVDATISAGTRSALFALSSMQNEVSIMENRLATGKRVLARTVAILEHTSLVGMYT